MKIYLCCDLEGIAGVVDHRQQCAWDVSKEWYAPYLDQARRLATLELNALVEGAVEGGATEIVAWDGHGNFPGGLDIELVHPECTVVMGAGDGGPEGLDSTFDALFQLGLHAMAGTPKAVLAHSFWGGIVAYRVNGLPVGEIWMNAYIVGMHDVPFIFLSGDRAAAEEAQRIVPDVEVAVVKQGLSEEPKGLATAPCISLPPGKAHDVIREAARRAMSKANAIQPLRVDPPFALQVEYREEKLAERWSSRPGVNRINATTVELKDAEHPWLLL
jgi:D-amino peptidase